MVIYANLFQNNMISNMIQPPPDDRHLKSEEEDRPCVASRSHPARGDPATLHVSKLSMFVTKHGGSRGAYTPR